MAGYLKIGGYAAQAGSLYNRYANSSVSPARTNNTGDPPNGATRQQPHRPTRAEQVVTRQADEVSFSAEAKDLAKLTQQVATTPVGIEPPSTPQARSRIEEPSSSSSSESDFISSTEPGSRIDFLA